LPCVEGEVVVAANTKSILKVLSQDQQQCSLLKLEVHIVAVQAELVYYQVLRQQLFSHPAPA
jgi:hypothetical protein